MKRKISNRPIILTIILILIITTSFFAFYRVNSVSKTILLREEQFKKDSSIFLNDLRNIKLDILNDNSNLKSVNGNHFDTPDNTFYFKTYNEKLSIVYYNDSNDKTFIKEFNDFEYLINEDIVNYYVIDNNSNIYYKYNEESYNSLMSVLNSTSKLDNALLKDYISYIDGDIIVSMFKLDDKFLLVETINKDDLITPLYVEVLVYIVFIIVCLLIIYSSIVYRRYKDRNVHFDLSNLVFNELNYIYLIEINKNGKILNFNNNIKNILKKRYVHINELISEKFSLKDQRLNINNIDRFFKLYQVNNKYFLINEGSVEKIENQNKLLYYNEFSNFKSLRSFNEDILNTKNTNTYFIFDIKNFKSLVLNNGKEFAYEIIKLFLNYLNDNIIKEEKEIYHIKTDVFIVTFKNKDINVNIINDYVIDFQNKVSNDFKVEIEFNVAKLYNENIKGLMIYETLSNILNKKKTETTNDILVYDNVLMKTIERENEVKTSLVKAVENNEFKVYYQPILNLKNNKVEGFEALIRWSRSSELEVSVEDYINILGRTNLIYDITTLTIKEVVNFIKKTNDKNINVSFNVTPKQFLEKGFINKLTNEIYKEDIDPHQISIEITENVFINEFKVINNKIKTLKSLGVKVFLDDFGTGYSSFKYLNDLDIDVLKLDKSFITNIETDKKLLSIVGGIINLAKGLNLDVIAEGVENSKQLNVLKDFKCDYIQGFLISKALNEKDALKLINKEYKF